MGGNGLFQLAKAIVGTYFWGFLLSEQGGEDGREVGVACSKVIDSITHSVLAGERGSHYWSVSCS